MQTEFLSVEVNLRAGTAVLPVYVPVPMARTHVGATPEALHDHLRSAQHRDELASILEETARTLRAGSA